MRPICICLATTFVALTFTGCSSSRSTSLPFSRSAGVASSAEDFSEYDRNPPPPRMASEPSPVPPARGISLTREIQATPIGFRKARHFQGCTDDCAETPVSDNCTPEVQCVPDSGCGTSDSCAAGLTCPCRLRLNCLQFLRPRNWSCLSKLKCDQPCGEVECTTVDSCAETACGTCAVPGDYCPAKSAPCHEADAQHASPLAPVMGEQTPGYDGRYSSGHSLQGQPPAPAGPSVVPEIPVDPIARKRFLEPPAWNHQPQSGQAWLNPAPQSQRLQEPPQWSAAQGRTTLTPSTTIRRTPVPTNTNEGIQIQPLVKVADRADAINQ